MSEPTDFQVVTWALDNGWTRTPPRDGSPAVWLNTNTNVCWSGDPALGRMRAAYAEAHKPRLAERIARELALVYDTHDRPEFFDPSSLEDRTAIAAVQRVLDEEGVNR